MGTDPNGRAAHEAGAKLDHGKNRLGLVIGGFSRALQAVGEVGTYGASKYTDNGWMEVPDGVNRYTDAMYRHLMKEASGERCDDDTALLHAAHAAWNALARLDLMLRDQKKTKAEHAADPAGRLEALVGQPFSEGDERSPPWERCSNCGDWIHPDKCHYPCNGKIEDYRAANSRIKGDVD